MSDFNIDIPTILPQFGKIRQVAYVVEDLEIAMQQWQSQRQIESFVVARNAKPLTNARYRGTDNHSVTIDLAFGYLGDIQVELIELKHSTPSMYQEALDRHQTNLQHYGVTVDDFDSAYQLLIDQGFQAIVDSGIEGIARMSYLEATDFQKTVFSPTQQNFMKTPEGYPIVLELIEWNAMTKPYFEKIEELVSAVPAGKLFVEFSLNRLTPFGELVKRLPALLWKKLINNKNQSVTETIL